MKVIQAGVFMGALVAGALGDTSIDITTLIAGVKEALNGYHSMTTDVATLKTIVEEMETEKPEIQAGVQDMISGIKDAVAGVKEILDAVQKNTSAIDASVEQVESADPTTVDVEGLTSMATSLENIVSALGPEESAKRLLRGETPERELDTTIDISELIRGVHEVMGGVNATKTGLAEISSAISALKSDFQELMAAFSDVVGDLKQVIAGVKEMIGSINKSDPEFTALSNTVNNAVYAINAIQIPPCSREIICSHLAQTSLNTLSVETTIITNAISSMCNILTGTPC